MKNIEEKKRTTQEKEWEIPEFLKMEKTEESETDNENYGIQVLQLQAKRLDRICNDIVPIKVFLFIIMVVLIIMLFK
jgi:hypothetical protein